jgi:hypothetical protein
MKAERKLTLWLIGWLQIRFFENYFLTESFAIAFIMFSALFDRRYRFKVILSIIDTFESVKLKKSIIRAHFESWQFGNSKLIEFYSPKIKRMDKIVCVFYRKRYLWFKQAIHVIDDPTLGISLVTTWEWVRLIKQTINRFHDLKATEIIIPWKGLCEQVALSVWILN